MCFGPSRFCHCSKPCTASFRLQFDTCLYKSLSDFLHYTFSLSYNTKQWSSPVEFFLIVLSRITAQLQVQSRKKLKTVGQEVDMYLSVKTNNSLRIGEHVFSTAWLWRLTLMITYCLAWDRIQRHFFHLANQYYH